ncbi:MAG: hypothetical protein HC902_00450 [Calothrix sp. SM1_5_4]|nr:hypothetical protein [Calothrix sp. SM1_5_4]
MRKGTIALCATILLSSLNAFAIETEDEAGTPRAKRVANDKSVVGLIAALSKQPDMICSPDTLGNAPISQVHTLVSFYLENGISKFLVGVKCTGNEQTGDLRYEIKGILGDGGNIIESVSLVK